MPTVLRIDGYRFFFFSNEGREPPHIHLECGDGYAKIWLDPVELAYSTGLTTRQLMKIRILVTQYQAYLKASWYDHFN